MRKLDLLPTIEDHGIVLNTIVMVSDSQDVLIDLDDSLFVIHHRNIAFLQFSLKKAKMALKDHPWYFEQILLTLSSSIFFLSFSSSFAMSAVELILLADEALAAPWFLSNDWCASGSAPLCIAELARDDSPLYWSISLYLRLTLPSSFFLSWRSSYSAACLIFLFYKITFCFLFSSVNLLYQTIRRVFCLVRSLLSVRIRTSVFSLFLQSWEMVRSICFSR